MNDDGVNRLIVGEEEKQEKKEIRSFSKFNVLVDEKPTKFDEKLKQLLNKFNDILNDRTRSFLDLCVNQLNEENKKKLLEDNEKFTLFVCSCIIIETTIELEFKEWERDRLKGKLIEILNNENFDLELIKILPNLVNNEKYNSWFFINLNVFYSCIKNENLDNQEIIDFFDENNEENYWKIFEKIRKNASVWNLDSFNSLFLVLESINYTSDLYLAIKNIGEKKERDVLNGFNKLIEILNNPNYIAEFNNTLIHITEKIDKMPEKALDNFNHMLFNIGIEKESIISFFNSDDFFEIYNKLKENPHSVKENCFESLNLILLNKNFNEKITKALINIINRDPLNYHGALDLVLHILRAKKYNEDLEHILIKITEHPIGCCDGYLESFLNILNSEEFNQKEHLKTIEKIIEKQGEWPCEPLNAFLSLLKNKNFENSNIDDFFNPNMQNNYWYFYDQIIENGHTWYYNCLKVLTDIFLEIDQDKIKNSELKEIIKLEKKEIYDNLIVFLNKIKN